ncbi:MAG: hypothetical protein CV045_08395 [Cyanobacteria bacterium M5B4]|nr:MAG: hypothetical protein CV045_08395 [Cyanobacteria bacterium M5B4]
MESSFETQGEAPRHYYSAGLWGGAPRDWLPWTVKSSLLELNCQCYRCPRRCLPQQQYGGRKPTITIGVRAAEQVQITIADNGPGIPAAIQASIFQSLFTTKPPGKGTGLGLSISKQIVEENHQGKLECFSQEGEGACFIVSLPLNATS